MKCAWSELLSILPRPLRSDVDMLGKLEMQELRLRLDAQVEMRMQGIVRYLKHIITQEDISYVINTASHYSPWAASTMASGYLTAPGGHRIGVCGEVVTTNGKPSGFRNIRSLCIRIARDFPGIASRLEDIKGNILILGPPGSGKTTLLRDLIRRISEKDCVTVIDERGELFPQGISVGHHTDVLNGCTKADGLMMAVRTMGPSCVAVDEITSIEDCCALTEAGWCGVRLLATAHGSDVSDLHNRMIYRPLLETGLFGTVVIMQMDKRYRLERL